MDANAERIRALNDQLRTTGKGGNIMMTAGIAALEGPKLAAIMTAVQTFDQFTPDNDPHSEHDCAVLEVEDERIIFKIDYYDCTMSWHSPDAADPKLTKRVMTIMLASEY
jgi:hypothetical protein